ncbi:MAG: SLC13 family permease [Geminicoccaceae bacterium]|nr:SLC13 family permease [Geminicoccaceae bacterium]MCB9967936.1 SLC13 family permease [Geminicoccaceae bacterium]HRY24984.1 SLC13 family permease [Geminicoccaceae bacterium]
MSDAAIVALIIPAALALFIWNRVPAVIVGVGVSLALFATGVITASQALAGLGDPTVILIAGLFVVAAGLEAAGVTTWAGQKLVETAGGSKSLALLLVMLMAAIFCAIISVNATVAALLPVAVIVAIRLGVPTSQLLLPMCFGAHAGTMLTLIGAPLNVIAYDAARDAGYGGIGFFEYAVAGLPIMIGSLAIMYLTQRFLLPHRDGLNLPADFSSHAATLVEQYRLEDGLHRLRLRETSPLVGQPRSAVDLARYPGLAFVAIEDASGGVSTRDSLAAGDSLLVRGDADWAGRLAGDLGLAIREAAGDAAQTLFNRGSGLAEVVIPPRSGFIGETAFPGMATPSGDLMILAIQRGGEDLGIEPVTIAAGDTLLLQGTWAAFDQRLADPRVLAVHSPELVRRQAIPLGHRAWQALGVLLLLVVLLVTAPFPSAITAVICAGLMVVLGVLTVPQMWRGVDWNTCILVGGMIPLAGAMTQSGLAQDIADGLILLIGWAGPLAVLAGLFAVTAILTQVMSNTATALVMLPVAVASGPEMGVSAMPMIIAVTVGAHAALLTPMATPVNLMVVGPGGYTFGDYWKYGLPILLWWLVVCVLIVPLWWRFDAAPL